MIDHELLLDLTESYLRSVIAGVSNSLDTDLDVRTPFGELGIDSFHVLKIIRKLEADFGTLSKSLLFENFNIHELANHFVCNHTQTLSTMFAHDLQKTNAAIHTNDKSKVSKAENHEEPKPVQVSAHTTVTTGLPIRILERDAFVHPELRGVVQKLFDRYKTDGSVSRGARKIAPNLFIGSTRQGYFNYGRSKNIILVYGYTGPRDYLPVLAQEMSRYCETNHFQLNILADVELPPIGGIAFSATPFGALQRLRHLKQFTLQGGEMRRLRYQVSKFQKNGSCRTEEYRCGSNQETDKSIASMIDKWCEARTMVNPLVHDVKTEILAGTLGSEHRLFLTYREDVLQNVIFITAMCPAEKGYLMDLEFYGPDLPLGGLEFAIVEIIKVLVAEGFEALSLGGTYGCKISSSGNEDPQINAILDNLRKQGIFNDEGNLQFKNKFRPENSTIFLCRPVGSGDADNVLDIIMMIADPERMQTSDAENHNFSERRSGVAADLQDSVTGAPSVQAPSPGAAQMFIENNARSRILAEAGFNPLHIPSEHVEFDLKTDSWAQLHMPSIDAHMRNLHAQLQQPAIVTNSVRELFPFSHFLITASGQEAEHLLFKAWQKKGVVLQNLLFPSTIFHQIDNGFTIKEFPHPAAFALNSTERYKGNTAWDALREQVVQDRSAIVLVCVEVSNNAAGRSLPVRVYGR